MTFPIHLMEVTPPVDNDEEPVFLQEFELVDPDQRKAEVEMFCVDGHGHRSVEVMLCDPDVQAYFMPYKVCEDCGTEFPASGADVRAAASVHY